jgi:beta-mannosidase
MEKIELLAAGALEGRLRLSRSEETWDLTFTAHSSWVRWKASRGFRFTAISALPYLPFNRFLGGSEYQWPTGPGEPEPADHDIAPRTWEKLPGGHGVYYNHDQNYGALGIVALDEALRFKGVGSRRFIASKETGDTEIAITFPEWRHSDTVLEARKENRIVRQPLLIQVTASEQASVQIRNAALREPETTVGSGALRPTPFQPQSLPLNGDWELAWTEKGAGPPTSGWRTVRVPGSVHYQWLEASKVFSRESEWISSKEWWYRRRITLPPAMQGKPLRLAFDATDYYADVWLNGKHIGRHEGYIDPYFFELGEIPNTSELLVRVWTPVSYYWKHRPYTIKGAYGAVDQKPDDITALGITRSVRLTPQPAATIRDIAVNTRLTPEGAEVEVTLDRDGGDSWEITLSPRNFRSPTSYQARGSGNRIVIPVKDPQLWWTWDHGNPNLYTLDVRLLDSSGHPADSRSIAIGIREIEKIGWNFFLNRKQMFIRGTNYYGAVFMAEANRQVYERDVNLMLQMNVNAIRLHCHFSNPEMYDLADERGILIWQDFLEAWYPHDTQFSLRASALYDNHIRYVRNHPSIAIWATSDEEDWENYRDLTKHLAPRLFLHDPQRRPVIRSTGRFGDAHVYHGWYNGTVWDYTRLNADFVSELGATSLPNYETLNKFMGGKWPIAAHAEEWTWRRLQIPEAMRAWGEPGMMTMEEYVPQTQAYVARLFQIALERMRQRKSEGAGGIFHFHAIDIWPSVTMAAIDIERRPTKVFDVVRRSFSPVAATFQYDRDEWKRGEQVRCAIWAINDRWNAVPNASVEWRIVDEQNVLRAQGRWPAPMSADSSQRLGDATWTSDTPGRYRLIASVHSAGATISENVFEFRVK